MKSVLLLFQNVSKESKWIKAQTPALTQCISFIGEQSLLSPPTPNPPPGCKTPLPKAPALSLLFPFALQAYCYPKPLMCQGQS